MRISDWSSDVCSSDLHQAAGGDSRMNLYPASDLKNGECVRLKQGDMAQVTVFNADPAAQARAWAAAGFRYLHLVDLDGAFAGRPANAAAVKAIRAAIALPIQLGGGIRDRSEEHTSELQSLMRTSYVVFCL